MIHSSRLLCWCCSWSRSTSSSSPSTPKRALSTSTRCVWLRVVCCVLCVVWARVVVVEGGRQGGGGLGRRAAWAASARQKAAPGRPQKVRPSLDAKATHKNAAQHTQLLLLPRTHRASPALGTRTRARRAPAGGRAQTLASGASFVGCVALLVVCVCVCEERKKTRERAHAAGPKARARARARAPPSVIIIIIAIAIIIANFSARALTEKLWRVEHGREQVDGAALQEDLADELRDALAADLDRACTVGCVGGVRARARVLRVRSGRARMRVR